jgi:hypothetical protein
MPHIRSLLWVPDNHCWVTVLPLWATGVYELLKTNQVKFKDAASENTDAGGQQIKA